MSFITYTQEEDGSITVREYVVVNGKITLIDAYREVA